jgi:hypothetical protein
MRNGFWLIFSAAVLAGIPASAESTPKSAKVSGKVTDVSGMPLDHAAIMVYEAHVRTGYSVFCPTCWADCGKHTFSDAEGNFNIAGLNPELVFSLLVVKDGHQATFVNKVDPAKGPADTAALKTRMSPADPSQYVRGRVVDKHGDPVPDAVVEQQGVITANGGRRFGPVDWIDLIAVTNQKGEFELAHSTPAAKIILSVSPRGMSSKLFTEPTGEDRKTLVVTEGATIRGRLVRDGKPVANAEVGLSTHSRWSGTVLPDMLIGTQGDGAFSITNVPPGRIWYLYGKMESLAAQGVAADLIECETKDDGQVVNVGDIQVRPAYTLRGRVVLSDGKAIPPDMRIDLSSDRASDTQTAVLDPEGRFEFKGLASGVYVISPSVRNYRSPDEFPREALVDHDVDNLVLTLQPVTAKR